MEDPGKGASDTGLTHLGARQYDPATGRFISVDPILDLAGPQQTHGYSYANNAPVAFSDPTGCRPDGPVGGPDINDSRHPKYGTDNGRAGSGWFRDVQAWTDLGGGELSQCGWAATDIPLLTTATHRCLTATLTATSADDGCVGRGIGGVGRAGNIAEGVDGLGLEVESDVGVDVGR